MIAAMSDTANWFMSAGLWALFVGVLLIGLKFLPNKPDGADE